MPWVVICQRDRPGMGRNLNKTYRNVLDRIRELDEDANTFITNNPTHPWASPGENEFIIDLTAQEAADINDGTNPLFHLNGTSTVYNEPRWQQQNTGSGLTPSFGSWEDPENLTEPSVWQADTEIPDDRWIVRLYDGDPLVSGVHIAELELEEGEFAGEKTIHLRLYTSADVATTTNAQDQKTEIAGKLVIFDFTSGVTTFGVKTNGHPGEVDFPSNHQYRVIGPGGEHFVKFRVFWRSIEPPPE